MRALVYFNSMAPAGGIERVIAAHIGFLIEAYSVTLLTKDNRVSFFPLPSSVARESLNIEFGMNMTSRLRRVLTILATFVRTTRELRRRLDEINPEIIYVATPLNLLELFLAGAVGRRIVATEHSSFSAYNSVYKRIVDALYPRVALLTVPTRLDSKRYTDKGIPNVYLPNPISLPQGSTSDLSSKVALCIGRLTADKRHDLLIDIWSMSNLSSQGWKLRIVGKGERANELSEQIRRLGLSESVSIIAPTTSIADEYMRASVFLLTSRAEGFGLVLAEAMTFGVPCISFDCPSGPRDIIEDKVSGRLVAEGDVSGYVSALQHLAADLDTRLKYGNESRLSSRRFQAPNVKVAFMDAIKDKFGPSSRL
jgi:glycosyltransferase involved in cell wall biosynthesis